MSAGRFAGRGQPRNLRTAINHASAVRWKGGGGARPRTSDRAVMIARSASDAAASKQGSGSGGVCESVEPEGRERRSNP